MRSIVISLAVAATAATASAQLAGVNGLNVVYGNGFHGFPSATRVLTNNGLAGVRLQETIASTAPGGGDFANRHFAFLSADGGASTYMYDGTSSFSITYRHRMANSTNPVLPNGSNTTEGGLWFLQGGAANPFADGGVFTVSNRTMFVAGMGAGFSILAEGNGSNPGFPPLTAGGWYTVRFDYWAPGALGAGSIASYQASVLDEASGNFRISQLTGWDQGSSWPTGLQAGTAIGFRFQNVPVLGVENNFDGEYADIVIGAVIPAPASAAMLAVGGLVALRRRR
ncbi:MAG TPA: hypothetical protein VFF65_10725 [Phycisphaerales bacterium]|nr:hypothetical protein [Phycisphaerales bacterium]